MNKSDGDIIRKPFKGLSIAQNYWIDEAFEKLKSVYKPSKIIELGTSYGGMSAWLANLFECPVITYDNQEWGDSEALRHRKLVYEELGVEFRIMDVLHDVLRFKIAEDFDEKTILLCDNGNKETEFKIYGELIKQGGIIMVHDYAMNHDYFSKEINGKYWNHFEFDGSKFNGYCEQHGLESFMQDEFEKAVWYIRIKK